MGSRSGVTRVDVRRDWGYADSLDGAIIDVLQMCQADIVIEEIRRADRRKDLREATDYEIITNMGKIAGRVRRPYYWPKYRDLTIRAWRKGNVKTEIHKLREGYGSHYLYAWANNEAVFDDWMLIDLDKLRASRLLDNNDFIPNSDHRTGLLPIPDYDLRATGCIVREKPDAYRHRGGRMALYLGTKTFFPVRGSRLPSITVHVLRYMDNGEITTFNDVQLNELWVKHS